jgi:1-acyl-sn-glycerol-3-phosphate acyltransferase
MAPQYEESRVLALAQALPPAQRLAFVDMQTPALSTTQAALLLLLLPLVIARLILLFCVLSIWLLLLLLLLTNRRQADTDRPRFRCYPLVVRSTFAVGRLAMAALGFHVTVTGRHHVAAAYARRTATAVVSNHVSYLDPFVLGAGVGPYHAVARSDVATWPIFGSVLRAFGYAAVDRREKGGEAAAPAGAGERLTLKLAERARRTGAWDAHPPLLVFPEGTTSSGNAVLRFKTGAFVAGAPVLPVAIRFKAGALNGGWAWRARPTRVFWLRRLSTETIHLCRLLTRPLSVVEVQVLPAYSPSEAERRDPVLFAANVREKVADALGVSREDCGSIDDSKAFSKAVAAAAT